MVLDILISDRDSDHVLSCSSSTEVAGLAGEKVGCGQMWLVLAYTF
jgi:hypothetical protein